MHCSTSHAPAQTALLPPRLLLLQAATAATGSLQGAAEGHKQHSNTKQQQIADLITASVQQLCSSHQCLLEVAP
jgi:hypothetical protein